MTEPTDSTVPFPRLSAQAGNGQQLLQRIWLKLLDATDRDHDVVAHVMKLDCACLFHSIPTSLNGSRTGYASRLPPPPAQERTQPAVKSIMA